MLPSETCPETVRSAMEQVVCPELDKLERRIGRTTKTAIVVAVAILIPVAGAAVAIYSSEQVQTEALSSHEAIDNVRAAAALVVQTRQVDVLQGQSAMLERVKGVEADISEIKGVLKDNNAILREMHARDVRVDKR